MKTAALHLICLSFLFMVSCDRAQTAAASPAASLVLSNASGVTVRVAQEHSDPTLYLSIPGSASGTDAVLLLLPEHVTVREHGKSEAEHLYMWRPGTHGSPSPWVRVGDALQYERDLGSGIHFLARASLQADGVLLHYEFTNNSAVDYDSAQAVSDPRMLSPLLHDVRLERTYVYQGGKFVPLASDMPERLTLPLNQWLPNRYRISYTWPVQSERVQKQSDGVTFLNATHRADLPVLATVSTDSKWIMATFSRNPGNLWTNPDLTCQHADPDVSLPQHGKAVAEEKILLFPGTLDDVSRKVNEQRGGL